MDQKLLEYVRHEIQSGVSPEAISAELAKNGWPPAIISQALFSVPTTATAGYGVKYAGFWVRYAAAMVDGILLYIVLLILGFVIGVGFPSAVRGFNPIAFGIFNFVLSNLVGWTYYVLMTSKYEATLGKMAVGLAVRAEDGQRLKLSAIVIREVPGKLLSALILMIGYIMAAFTERKQALHDKLAHSVVVYKNPNDTHRGTIIVVVILSVIVAVAAIIGIFSAVVLGSLNSARTRADNASIMLAMRYMKVEAELYFNDKGSYGQAPDCYVGMFQQMGQSIVSVNKTGGSPICLATGASYAVSTSLPASGSVKTFCIDPSGDYENSVAVVGPDGAECSSTNKQIPYGGEGAPPYGIKVPSEI